MEFIYGDLEYTTQLAKLSTLWREPQRVDLARHSNNIAPDYIEWNSNRAKNVVLPAEVKDLSRARVEITRQEHGVPREASPGKVV